MSYFEIPRMFRGTNGGESRIASQVSRLTTQVKREHALRVRTFHDLTFNFTGDVQTWNIPANATIDEDGTTPGVLVVVAGAAFLADIPPATGGFAISLSGLVTASLSVAGETLAIYVGGRPTSSGYNAQPFSSGSAEWPDIGGWNGGGDGGDGYDDVTGTVRASIGGCGASDIRVGGSTLADRVVVAGGSGYCQQAQNYPTGPYYAYGGNPDGGDSLPNQGTGYPTVAKGATQSAGGAGGASSPNPFSTDFFSLTAGTDGSFGVGGDGGDVYDVTPGIYSLVPGGFGGGGGYYGGGGGGYYVSGAGGSSWADDGGVAFDVSYALSAFPHDGSIEISYWA